MRYRPWLLSAPLALLAYAHTSLCWACGPHDFRGLCGSLSALGGFQFPVGDGEQEPNVKDRLSAHLAPGARLSLDASWGRRNLYIGLLNDYTYRAGSARVSFDNVSYSAWDVGLGVEVGLFDVLTEGATGDQAVGSRLGLGVGGLLSHYSVDGSSPASDVFYSGNRSGFYASLRYSYLVWDRIGLEAQLRVAKYLAPESERGRVESAAISILFGLTTVPF